MKQFEIIIEETVSKTYEIEAETYQEAIEIARKGYRDGEYVLEDADLESADILYIDEKGNYIKENIV